VDSRLRRFPPLRCAQSCGRPVENAARFPPPAHRPVAAHKLHSVSTTFIHIHDSGRYKDRTGCIAAPETTDAVDLWTVGFADSHLCAARNPVDGPWKTLRVSHRPPTGRWLPTSSTAYPQRSYIFMIREDTRIELAASPRPKPRTLWICGQSASPIPTFALRAILWTARGKRCAFPTARPQAGGCPQAPQRIHNVHTYS
jgi:hypothetical protein